ncbi:hypothetical protein CK203_092438 [Vitis vinifera]|uniref:DUF4283 domain-containing protein n=1 Tax=Vitis vinifera TaxID=29760 RepID=A0A438DY02_VITVI|nr:hypothetical protein CK203_092438 [Vitis vinifera]
MAKFWVAIESKTFEVSIEEIKGKLKECFEECCREEKKGRLVKVWEEEGRKFRLERRVNGAGRYVLCSVVDVEAKRFCLVFPEGKGLIGGWAILAEKLRVLGIVTKKEDKGEELWLQAGGRGLRRTEEVLGRCLVGRWEGAAMEMESDSFKTGGNAAETLGKELSIGDCCGGLVEVDEDTKNLSHFNGPGFCSGADDELEMEEGERVREKGDEGSRAGIAVGRKRKDGVQLKLMDQVQSEKEREKKSVMVTRWEFQLMGWQAIARRKERWAQVKKTVWVGLIAASLGAKWPSPEIVKAWSMRVLRLG